MSEFFTNISNPGWWLGVVFVGLLLNIASSYLKPFIDNQLAKFSEKKRNALAARHELEEKLVDKLSNSVDDRKLLKLEIIDLRVQGVMHIVLSLVFMTMYLASRSLLVVAGKGLTFGSFFQIFLLFSSALICSVGLLPLLKIPDMEHLLKKANNQANHTVD
jgi:hypothetical protein